MPECEHARDVRRRHHDRKRWLRRLRICYEIAILQPVLIPLRFNRIRIVSLGKLSHRDQSSEKWGAIANDQGVIRNRFRLSLGIATGRSAERTEVRGSFMLGD